MENITEIKQFAIKMRKTILFTSFNCGESSHLGGALSIVELISCIYCHFFNLKKK